MTASDLDATARAMVAPGQGILAADESNRTMGKRLEAVDIESTEDIRRAYRHLLITTPGLGDYISGIILYDETFRQTDDAGTPLVQLAEKNGVMPGIKVDTGAKPLAGSDGEKVTEGLDGLRERLEEYAGMGARFAKWRAVIAIDGEHKPSWQCIHANAHALARYAAQCQEVGIVPIVEPEVLIDGDHSIDRCEQASTTTLRAIFSELIDQNVRLEGCVLKPNMVLAGTEHPRQADIEEVVDRTLRVLHRTVPPALPGVAFLSGGQGVYSATQHLQALNARGPQPWHLTFSYARALQEPVLEAWRGKAENVEVAQRVLATRARLNAAARDAAYSTDMEPEPAGV
jgi:fructose-bisphosphate aldolase class I